MLNLLFGLWQLGWVWGLGFLLARRIRSSLPYGYWLAVAFGLGEAALSGLYFLLGLAGGLRFGILVPLAVLISIAALPAWMREGQGIPRAAGPYFRHSPLAGLITVSLLTWYLLGVCVPEREVDSLWYHLGVPLYYITHGGAIQLVPFNMPSHYPMNLHLHYTFSLLVGNDTTAKMFIYGHFFPMLILLAAAVRRYGRRGWSLFAVAVYLCCLHFRMPVMVNVERAVYFYVFLSTALMWLAMERNSNRWLILSSVFCGMAMGTKFNGLLFGLVPLWLFLAIRFFLWKKASWRDGLVKLALFTGIAWMLYSPWMIKSFLFTGNPMYPMLEEIFPTREEFIPAMRSNAHNHGLNILKSKSPGEFVGQVETNILWLLYNADLIFFLGLMALFLLLVLRKKRWLYPATQLLLAFLLFPMLWGSDIARLYAANYGVAVLGIALAVSWLSRQIRWGRWLGVLILLSLAVTFTQQRLYYLSSPNIRWFGDVHLSEPARRAWLIERGLFTDDLFRMKDWMDSHIPPEEELYGYRTGYLFYLDRKYIVSDAHFGEQMDGWLQQGAETAARKLTGLGVDLVLYKRHPGVPLREEIETAWREFVHRDLELLHQEGNVDLYRLRAGGKPV
ncbi:MAG: hypothetical protein ACE15F_02920 [bacterium]